MSVNTTRRTFVEGLSGGTAALNLKCEPAHASDDATPAYRAFEDLYQAYKDFTCDYEKADPNSGLEVA